MSRRAKLLSSLGLLLGALLCVVLGAGLYYLFEPCCGSPEPTDETALYLGGLGALACVIGSIAVWFQPTKK